MIYRFICVQFYIIRYRLCPLFFITSLVFNAVTLRTVATISSFDNVSDEVQSREQLRGHRLDGASLWASPRDPREAELSTRPERLWRASPQDQLELSRPEKKIASVFGHSLRS